MKRTLNPSATALWASAFVVAALVVVQAGRLPGSTAYAEMEASAGDYTLLTARTGRGPETRPYEVLYVIDNREQVLIVYELEDAQRGNLTVRGGGPLPALFNNARPR
jgi:hypothetical protein